MEGLVYDHSLQICKPENVNKVKSKKYKKKIHIVNKNIAKVTLSNTDLYLLG